MNGLRLVWIISSHYNKDERMVPLMERIAWELAERVKRVVNVRVLFRFVFSIGSQLIRDLYFACSQYLIVYPPHHFYWISLFLFFRQRQKGSGQGQGAGWKEGVGPVEGVLLQDTRAD